MAGDVRAAARTSPANPALHEHAMESATQHAPTVKIYRGTREIGGTCVELTADNGKVLWVDLGVPLDSTNPDIDYAQNKFDALLISHPHQDHFGLMEKVGTTVPIFIGELSLDLINATKIFMGIPQLNANFKTIRPWESFTIADTFRVKPFLTDHSTPEAFAFLIEADGKRRFQSDRKKKYRLQKAN